MPSPAGFVVKKGLKIVTTFSGVSGTEGYLNGPLLQALYRQPIGIAVDATGNLFVADTHNHVVRIVYAK